MVREEIARRKLKEIRTVQGWREAYRASGLKDEGSDGTKRRRLSRLINKKTTGARKLTKAETKRINRSYGSRSKSLKRGRADRAIKKINQDRAIARRNARRAFGSRGTSPNPQKLNALLRQNAPMTDEEKDRLEEYAQEDRVMAQFRASYYTALKQTDPNLMSPEIRRRYQRRLEKAENAHKRDVRDGTVQSRIDDF